MKEFLNINLLSVHGRPFLADVFLPEHKGPHPVVIFAHGFKGFKDWGPFNIIARNFVSQGFCFVKFNFAWNGTTPDATMDFTDLEAFANNNFTKELDDMKVVIDMIHKQPEWNIDLKKIFLIGHSRGGGIALLKAAEDDRVKGVITWAAVAGFARHITVSEIKKWKEAGVFYVENSRTGQQMPLYPQLYEDFYRNRHRLNIVKAAGKVAGRMLVVHGDADETVPLSHAHEIISGSPGSKILILPDADHSFGATHPFTASELPPDFKMVVDATISYINGVIQNESE